MENLKEKGENFDKNTENTPDLTEKGQQYVLKKKPIYSFIKRGFDIFNSALFMIIFCWLYLILAIIVKCSDGGKVIYRQKRVGKKGKTVYIAKFRTMKPNADKLENTLTEEQMEKYLDEFKLDNDDRITKVGKFLRKTSLDELPQMWDIFVGKLSFVGPRPLLDMELKSKYGENADKLVSVKPGLTGYWAVNGRNDCTYKSGERQKLELYYVDNRSIGLDLKIILKTFLAVFGKKGAK